MRRVVHSSSLRALLLLALGALLLRPGSATAFNMEGADIVMDLLLPDKDGDLTRRTPNEEDRKDHFNLANCLCPGVEFGIEFTVSNPPASFSESAPVDVWAGSGCDAAPENINVRDNNCELVGGFADIDALLSRELLAIEVGSLLAPTSATCPLETGSRSVYAMIDRGSPGIVGASATEVGSDYVAPLYDITFDTEPPPVPENVSASGGEGAISLNWKLPLVRGEDIRYFQVLCARADGSIDPNDGFGEASPEYLTTRMACEQDLDGAHPGAGTPPAPDSDAGTEEPDAGTPPDAGLASDLPLDLYNLEPSTICAGASGTENGVRVEGLENGVPYRLVLVSVDESRNVTAIDIGTHTPQPVEDGWEHYKEAGGQADGGFCYVATATYGNYDHVFVRILRDFRDDTLAHSELGRDFIGWYYANSPALATFIKAHTSARVASYLLLAPLVAAAAVWEYTGALGKLLLLLGCLGLWMRRKVRALQEQSPGAAVPPTRASPRRRALLAIGTVLLLAAFSATAHAQPYWDELQQPIDSVGVRPNWNFEIKAGPYYPSVDDEFEGDAAPFERIFGDKWKLMTVLGLDRYFAFPMGQLGVTGSLGFMTRSAAAFQQRDGHVFENSKGELVRSKGDMTTFRVVPTTLGLVYRFTALDDNFGIPILPYGKASLAYYLWWFTDSNGLSESRTPECPNAGSPDADCDGNLARGGSLGYQATIGIAIRAERIDPSAAMSLRNEMGIAHAGFFIEGTLAQVDGFGAGDKLSVGDTTWFGGINFEF